MSASGEDGLIQSLAATCAILAGLAGLLYSLAVLGLVVAGVGPATGMLVSSLMLLVAGPAALVGLIVNPAWSVWLGLTLRDGRR